MSTIKRVFEIEYPEIEGSGFMTEENVKMVLTSPIAFKDGTILNVKDVTNEEHLYSDLTKEVEPEDEEESEDY